MLSFRNYEPVYYHFLESRNTLQVCYVFCGYKNFGYFFHFSSVVFQTEPLTLQYLTYSSFAVFLCRAIFLANKNHTVFFYDFVTKLNFKD